MVYLTGDSHTSGASSIRSETSFGAAINRTADLKMALAVTKKDAFNAKQEAEQALKDKDKEIEELKKQMAAAMATVGSGPACIAGSQRP